MSYVRTIADPLYQVRRSALGRLRTGIRRPSPGLGSFSTDMLEKLVAEVKRKTAPAGIFVEPSTAEITVGPRVGTFLKRVFEEDIRRKPIEAPVDRPTVFVPEPTTVIDEFLKEMQARTFVEMPTTIVERVLDEGRRKAIPVELPGFEVDDAVIVGPPRKEEIQSKTRSEVISVPIDKADATLAFQLGEAAKYGFTHAAWMALGVAGRTEVRQANPDGYKPTTPGGTPLDAATVQVIAGPDPLRQQVHDTGSGDYPNSLEIKTPPPNVPLTMTTAGLTFDDILQVDPIRIQTAEEAAGLLPVGVQKYAMYSLLAVGAWILYDSLLKAKRPRRRAPARRRAPVRRRPRRTRRR